MSTAAETLKEVCEAVLDITRSVNEIQRKLDKLDLPYDRPSIRQGDLIRQLREKSGLSQLELCREIGVTKTMLSMVELDKTSFSLECTMRLIDALDLGYDDRCALLSPWHEYFRSRMSQVELAMKLKVGI